MLHFPINSTSVFCQGVAAPNQEHGQHQEEEEGGGGGSGGLDTSKGGQLKMDLLIFYNYIF